MSMEMPKVLECSAEGCAYNAEKSCHAMAITIGEPGGDPSCDTFFSTGKQGGVMDMTAGVGACKLDDCKFNQDYECTASNITVGMQQNQPDCMTYQTR